MAEECNGALCSLINPPKNIIENRLFRRQWSLNNPCSLQRQSFFSTDNNTNKLNHPRRSQLVINLRLRRLEKKTAPTKDGRKTYLVIIFSEKARLTRCVDVEKIIQEFGILTTLEVVSKTEKYLYLTASTDKLLRLADVAEISKITVTGSMRKFNYYTVSDYLIGSMSKRDILRSCEPPVLIKDAVKPSLMSYIRNGTIEHFFPLHDIEFLNKFSYNFGLKLPIEDIRDYYGSSIGLYFAFIEFYTKALIFPSLLGLVQVAWELNLPIVCGFYVIWTTVFLELWKRKCSGLSYRWGTINMSSLDIPRTAYRGEMKPDPITGKMTLQYPMQLTYMQMYGVSYPVVFFCIVGAGYFALYQFQIEDEVLQDFGSDSLLLYIPVIVQSVLITIFSWAYEKLATFLTDMENHRTRSQYDSHRVNKLVLFEIVNNFFSLFYIAFILQDLKQLKYQLMMQLIIFQVFCMLQEIGIPLMAVIRQKFAKYISKEMDDETRANIKDWGRYEQTIYEAALDEYQTTYEDYLQMCIQFGYVVLFAAVAPFAAMGALLNNVFALYIDVFKLSNIFKRPFARRAKNIGAWQSAFEILSVLSILSNCGLLYLQPTVRDFVANLIPTIPNLSFIIFEHLLLGLKFFIHILIHKRPRWVRIAMLKSEYESSSAYKDLRKLKSAFRNHKKEE